MGYLNPSLNNVAQDSGFRIPQENFPGLPYLGRVDSRADPIWQHYQFYRKLLRLLYIAHIFSLLTLAKSLHLILEIRAIYRLVSYLLADN